MAEESEGPLSIEEVFGVSGDEIKKTRLDPDEDGKMLPERYIRRAVKSVKTPRRFLEKVMEKIEEETQDASKDDEG